MHKKPKNLFQKVWDAHLVAENDDAPSILYIDLHLIHEVTSPQAFSGLRDKGLKVRRPERTIGTMDHSIPTLSLDLETADDMAVKQLAQFEKNCTDFGIQFYGMDSPNRGIVHVIGPEQGFTQPGQTIVCGDSHTSTHGAFGALAFGIGTSEVEHVLATQALLQNRPKTCLVKFEGKLQRGVTAKDMILALIARIGIGGGTGHVFEYAGEAIRTLNMEERMTLCNMSIEAGARAGMIAPDNVTFEYLAGRPYAPSGEAWKAALKKWRQLPSDKGAEYDQTITIDVSKLEPMVTFGTNPGMGTEINSSVPSPIHESDPAKKSALEKALAYMDLAPASALKGHPVDVVFIGSCTNSRMSDLRAAASILKGRKVAEGIRLLVVPGSENIRLEAEAEGIDEIVREAGGEWRFAGCSMCIAMNGDNLEPGQYAVSTSNRNFEGRQGKGGRTFLASPLTAAASAITGKITDPREFI
ncbi:MAG: 3-isopropylmalate dehydratase large subunit [Anaerolineales bacterium]|uniref:3-isopropylmalate dehydratase large subunit n=1 Tax=Candidatus Desulfolinea nitratireducens TaxID=2841698 RepID=A0A8J6NIK2_9CHLR|nr:3-isopropylmalate dehydratase large subunit [Candidatus Desulfolinea nitratireducens]